MYIHVHCESEKTGPLLFLRKLWQMWTDFNNSFTFGFVYTHLPTPMGWKAELV